jgi:large subunit ribosomal protein L11
MRRVIAMAEKLSDMIKKEAGVEKGAATGEAPAGDITLDKLIGIAQKKREASLGRGFREVLKEAAGTCRSIGITIDGKDALDLITEIEEGKHDSLLAGK